MYLRRPTTTQIIGVVVVILVLIKLGTFSNILAVSGGIVQYQGARAGLSSLKEPTAVWSEPWEKVTAATYSELRASSSEPTCELPPRFDNFDESTFAGKFGCDTIDELMHEKKLVGNGLWREVFRARHEDQFYVVKRVKQAKRRTERALRRHRNEALISTELAAEDNIVRYYGICKDTVINEYCEKSLDKILYNPKVAYTFMDAMDWVVGVSRAIAALHLKMKHTRIIHADLQPRQILVCDDVVRVGDFNRARVMHRDAQGAFCSFLIPKSQGRWRAPEEFDNTSELTERLDVYSVGLIIYAIFHRQMPFANFDTKTVGRMWKKGKAKIDLDPTLHHGIRSLIEDCTRIDPLARPNAGHVLERAEALREQIADTCPDERWNKNECDGGPLKLEDPTRHG